MSELILFTALLVIICIGIFAKMRQEDDRYWLEYYKIDSLHWSAEHLKRLGIKEDPNE